MKTGRLMFEAKITFRPANEGGRTHPLDLNHPTARYRPHITVKVSTPPELVVAEDRLAVQFPQQCPELQPGQPTHLRFEPLYLDADYSALQPGVQFNVLEGPLLVATGRVRRVIESAD